MMPPDLPSDMERSFWARCTLEPTVTTLDTLIATYPETNTFTSICHMNRGYKVIGHREKDDSGKGHYFSPLAYECTSCKNVVTGPPNFSDDESLNNGQLLAGRIGYDLYCTHCSSTIYTHTDELS